MHTCARSKSGGKGTKKNPYTQIYAEKSAKYFSFAREKGDLGGIGYGLRVIGYRLPGIGYGFDCQMRRSRSGPLKVNKKI